MGLTPTQRTLKKLREMGRESGIVEKFVTNGRFGFRKDLFGFIDIISISEEDGIVGVQSFGQDFSAHYKKITEECRDAAIKWLKCGGRIELWGWRKLKVKRGGKAMRWKERVYEMTREDFKDDVQ